MGLCALVLCLSPVVAQASSSSQLETTLARHLNTMTKDESVIRFFETHRWLLTDPRFAAEARHRLRAARTRLAETRRKARETRRLLATKRAEERSEALLAQSPREAICSVFGSDCGEAVAVARCESRLDTRARNGQYLGLFQMGSSERRLFGHGPTAYEQARAAHRYFVQSGRDWSPWTCKPWW
jgi:hypothetical protein